MKNKVTEQGMSLVEIMVTTTIFATVMYSALMFFHSSQTAVNSGYVKSMVEEKARIAVERMVKEIRMARRSSAPEILDVQTNYITFQPVTGFASTNGAEPTTAPEIEYRLENDPAELLGDGIDNNNNGLIDETNSRLVREQDGDVVIITRNVESLQFTGSTPAGKVTIALTLVAKDPENRMWSPADSKYLPVIHRATVITDVFLRTIE